MNRNSRTASPHLLRRALPLSGSLVLALAFASTAAAQADPAAVSPASDAQYLIYLPSRAANVDQDAIFHALDEVGFTVIPLAYAGETKAEYAWRAAGEVRALIANGVAPEAITVLGAGSGTSIAALTSAATGNRHVNFVLLGRCDPLLKTSHTFRMSGRVLGLRDSADAGSGSCRPLWSDSPKVSERRDMVVSTGFGATLFDQPRPEWMQPVAEWIGGGRVDVGKMRIGSVERPASGHGKAVTGAGD